VKFRLLSKRTACLAGAAALALTAAACSSSSSSSSSSPSSSSTAASATSSSTASAAAPTAGGSLTVLESTGYSGDWPFGLDPATNTDGAADQDYMTAVYGQLFELGAGGKIVDDLATGYQFSNGGKTITIDLRKGVKFTDGTPFNASVVVWNIDRDLESPCTCAPVWNIARVSTKPGAAPAPGVITATGPYTVQINLTVPDGAFIDQIFDATPNWIASEVAYNKLGEKAFAQTPVGAGPFIVVSDDYSNTLVLKKNPNYWDAPLPYLDNLTFKSVASDEAGYEALLAGQGQVYVDMSTPALLTQSAQHFNVVNQLGTSPYDLQLNTASAPFNNIKARQAIYAATNFAPILAKIFDNLYPPAQGFTGPGGICYSPTVPGYQGYDPTLAKQLVAQSGLSNYTITLGTIQNQVAQETTEALQTEWSAVGIKTKIASYPLAGLIQAFTANKGTAWQAMIQTAGSYDPAAGVGVGFRFSSTSVFSGVHDPKLDALLNSAAGSTDLSTRCSIYNQAAAYIAKEYYGPFYFSFAPANVAVKGVGGPGLSASEPLPAVVVTPTIPWEDVYYNSGS
jgi:peptide/nickel transport system substrate-binding protein